MITTLLKQKYLAIVNEIDQAGPWIKQNFDANDFINQMAAEHNTTPEMIKILLKDCEWFK